MPSNEADRAPDSGRRMSRRSLLQGATAAGAAGLAVTAMGAAASPALAATGQPSAAGRPQDRGEAQAGPIIVHVRDARSGDIEVFAGTSATRLHDQDLAARIARAIG